MQHFIKKCILSILEKEDVVNYIIAWYFIYFAFESKYLKKTIRFLLIVQTIHSIGKEEIFFMHNTKENERTQDL